MWKVKQLKWPNCTENQWHDGQEAENHQTLNTVYPQNPTKNPSNGFHLRFNLSFTPEADISHTENTCEGEIYIWNIQTTEKNTNM